MTETQTIYLLHGESVTIEAREPDTPPEHPWTDMRADMPENHAPDHPWFVANGRTWWTKRTTAAINSITIHHTMAHNLSSFAAWSTRPQAQGGKGIPTIQYTFWITARGEALYCVDLEDGFWHDHTPDDPNLHLSIGLAGRWDYEPPPLVQMRKAADLCEYLMQLYPGIHTVKGHCDYFTTACPGWNGAGWRDQFYAMLGGVSYGISMAHIDHDYAEFMDAE